jgi:hypothetical protein
MKMIEAETLIEASPEQVWSVLADFEKWPQWNRIMPGIEGELEEGARVKLTLALPGRRTSYQKPLLTRVTTNQELRWYEKVISVNIFASEHWFRLEATTNGCRVRHGEQFDGFLSAMMGKKTLAETERLFTLMNRDLKERVEETG